MKKLIWLFTLLAVCVSTTACVKKTDTRPDAGAGACSIGGHANSGSHTNRQDCEGAGGIWH